MKERILFVDDDADVLAAIQRQLRARYAVEIAQSGREALARLDPEKPFAAVVADMRMPEMDGIQLLGHYRSRCPHTVRIMLTGHADTETAIQAVNEGSIFRFLTKPCRPEALELALAAAVEQFRLLEAERELLEKTLQGSVKVLTDTLSLLNPVAFSRGSRIRRTVKEVAMHLGLPAPWEYELAAMLSQIGCVTVPQAVLERVMAGRPLSQDEMKMFSGHPAVGAELLANIPRLGRVARMIEGQLRSFRSYPRHTLDEDEACAASGAQLLKLCLDFDALLLQGVEADAALIGLQERHGEYNPRMLAALSAVRAARADAQVLRDITWRDARPGMVAAEHIRTLNGLLLVPQDQEFTPQVLARLRNFALRVGVKEPFLVAVGPSAGASRRDAPKPAGATPVPPPGSADAAPDTRAHE